MLALALVLLLCWPAAGLAAPAEANPCPPPAPRLLSVEGSGEVSLAPSAGEAALSVEVTAPTATKALGQVSEATQRVLAALKGKLGPADRATTEGYDLFPLYDMSREGRGQRLTGYRAVSRLRLAVAERPERLGELLDAAVQGGASGLSEVRFTNPGLPEARRQAAAAALKEARALAERLAEAAGVRVGRLVSVSAGEAGGGPQPLRYRAAGMMAAEAAPPMEPGELRVRATVSAVYEIEGR